MVQAVEDVKLGYYDLYDVFHICSCGKIYSHSQGDCDEHRLHELPHSTYPIEALRKLRQVEANCKEMGKFINANVLCDLLASHCYHKGIYKTYQKACDAMTELAQDLVWYDLKRW